MGWGGGGGAGEHEAAPLLMVNLYMSLTESSRVVSMQLLFAKINF
jgi:hypothetical protein